MRDALSGAMSSPAARHFSANSTSVRAFRSASRPRWIRNTFERRNNCQQFHILEKPSLALFNNPRRSTAAGILVPERAHADYTVRHAASHRGHATDRFDPAVRGHGPRPDEQKTGFGGRADPAGKVAVVHEVLGPELHALNRPPVLRGDGILRSRQQAESQGPRQ